MSPDKLQLLELPTWEEVEALLANPVTREFRLDIETDSTIRMDEEMEKASRMELLKAVSEYMQQAMAAGAQAPEIVPMLAELLMFGIRAFTTARDIEQTFEDMMHALEQAAKQPRPNPEAAAAQIKAQADITIAQHKADIETHARGIQLQMEAQQNAQEEANKASREREKMQMDAQLDQWKAELKARMDLMIEEHKSRFEAQRVQFEAGHEEHMARVQHGMARELQTIDQTHDRQMGGQQRLAQDRQQRGRNGGTRKAA